MTAFAPTAGSPVHLTRFIGRQQELASLRGLLETTRLLTLTGAGGSGKTRLAAIVASEPIHGNREVAWVDLAPLTDPALLAHQIVAALGARETAPANPLSLLWEQISSRQLLLVLDNCEHLVDACAALAESMLLRADGLKILATSREALGIGGETAWLVPPLSLPATNGAATAHTIGQSESVQLFVERARSVAPEFRLTDENAHGIAQICRRLDGLPLAIELAAARVRALSPDQIAERLDDAFRVLATGGRTSLARHRTLRETIDWSYSLLSEREQRLLDRLSVFAGGFTLEAAEAVAADDELNATDVLDPLCALVDKSLVVMYSTGVEARYRLVETVSQYAAEKLAQTDGALAVRERHTRYYLSLAEAAAPHIVGGASDCDWLARLDVENDNLRLALDWCAEDAERTDIALRLTYALHWFWFAGGHLREGRRRLEHALANRAHAFPPARGRALIALNQVMSWQGHPPDVRIGQEAVELLRPDGDPESLAYALSATSVAHYLARDPVAADPPIEEAWELLKGRPLTVLTAIVLYWRSRSALEAGNLSLARTSAEGALGIGRQSDSQPAIAHPLTVLGAIATAQGLYEEALSCLMEGLEIHAANGDRWGVIQALHGLLRIAAKRDAVIAARLLGITQAVRTAIGSQPSGAEALEIETAVTSIRGAIGEKQMEGEKAQGLALSLPDAVAYTLSHVRNLATAPLLQVTGEFPIAALAERPSEGRELRVDALGGLKIFRGEDRLEEHVWGSAKAKELLLFLLCHPDGSTKEQVGLAFWPDGSTAQVRNNFHVTLHRLRKALGGSDWVALSGDRYSLDAAVQVDFDAAIFEKHLQAALTAVRRQASTAIDQLADACALYRGDFLANENVGDWCEPFRTRLHRAYTDGATRLVDLLTARKEHDRAADVLEALIERNPLHEESYRRLMTCYAQQGRHVEALRLYQRLAELLDVEFGATPALETKRLSDRLRTPVA